MAFWILQNQYKFFSANISAKRWFAFQIDGVESLNNVLLIGMTNRKDLLDEALLRSLSLSLPMQTWILFHEKTDQSDQDCQYFITKSINLFYYLFLMYRPGRLEVQIEISLPDENGRLQILQIHTNKMKENSFLAPDVNLQKLGMCIGDICLWDVLIHLLLGWSDRSMETLLFINYISWHVLISLRT